MNQTEEQRIIQDTFKSFCEKELNYQYVKWMDENVDFPPDELWQKFVDMGFMSSTIPEEYGGQAMGQFDSSLAYEQICKKSMSVALALGVTQDSEYVLLNSALKNRRISIFR